MTKSEVPLVLLVDDEPDHLRLLSDILIPVNCQLVTARNAKQALAFCQQEHFALGIVDVRLPDLSGLELIPQLRALNAEMQFFLITAFAQVSETLKAVRDLQAIDYIKKPFSPRDVRKRVSGCLVDLGYSKWPRIGDLVIKPEDRRVEQRDNVMSLTDLEFDLLFYLTRQWGRTASYEELFENVWGEDPGLAYVDIVEDTVNRLQVKLGDDPQDPRYIQAVSGVGYRLIARS